MNSGLCIGQNLCQRRRCKQIGEHSNGARARIAQTAAAATATNVAVVDSVGVDVGVGINGVWRRGAADGVAAVCSVWLVVDCKCVVPLFIVQRAQEIDLHIVALQ